LDNNMPSLLLKSLLLVALVCVAVACSRVPDGADRRNITVAGVARSYLLYAPQVISVKPALVLVLHGFKGSAAEMERRTQRRFDALADRDGFVVAYPEALRAQWNAGHPWEQAQSDDVGFLAALIDALSGEFDVHPTRIYVTGLSNGAAMSYRLACERPDRIAAIAAVAGGLAERLMRPCAALSRRPIPLLVIHGTEDRMTAFDSGELEGNIQYWIRRNGCTLSPVVTRLPDIDPADGTRTRVESYGNCSNEADVALYAIEGGGHQWPGGTSKLGSGNLSSDFDAADVIWDFFKATRGGRD
jgi:polyhydroxybutyrate depolymerase